MSDDRLSYFPAPDVSMESPKEGRFSVGFCNFNGKTYQLDLSKPVRAGDWELIARADGMIVRFKPKS